MIPGIFITGTGTDVGKTVVTAGILRWLRHNGTRAMVMKPVQTGCHTDGEGRLRAPDVDFVLRAAEISVDEETLARVAPYRFEPACSPHLAARMAGQRIELAKIVMSARWLAQSYRRLVVEGAGGIAVPLNDRQTMLDLICEMEMPVLLVAHSGLGTINHVLLSLEALRGRGCKILGVVLNDTEPVTTKDYYIHEDNVEAVSHYGSIEVTRIPYLRPGLRLPRQWDALDAIIDDCEFLNECLV